MKFIALKTCEGGAKGRISFCCKALKVTRQGFHDYLKNRNKPWKHEELAAKMMEILSEDAGYHRAAKGGKRLRMGAENE